MGKLTGTLSRSPEVIGPGMKDIPSVRILSSVTSRGFSAKIRVLFARVKLMTCRFRSDAPPLSYMKIKGALFID